MEKYANIFYTIWYLKPIQIFYQIWYRIKNKILKIDWYIKYQDTQPIYLNFKVVKDVILSSNKLHSNNTFVFLNLKKEFGEFINWNFLEHGKLWNYNLQYFDYLQDEVIPYEVRLKLIKDFSNQLLNGAIKLEPYPVSLRIVNSIIFISNHKISCNLILKSLYAQIRYLEKNAEYHLLANHVLENIFALFISSIFLNNKTLYQKTSNSLVKQLKEQILNDGAHYECSPMYHSIILSKLLLCIDAAKNKENLKLDITLLNQYASKMLGWMNAFSFSNGDWALVNDAALNIAPTTKKLNEACRKLNIKEKSSKLNESGYRKLVNASFEVLVDVGNIIPSYQPGHAHSDALSFCLFQNYEQLIVDSGISTYNNVPQRWLERSTKAHNTVEVNKVNQTKVWSAFRVGKRAKVTIKVDTEKQIIAFHNGYKNISITHQRNYQINTNQLIIKDEVFGKSKLKNKATGYIYISPKFEINHIGENKFKVKEIIFEFINTNAVLKETSVAEEYNKVVSSKRFEYDIKKFAIIKIYSN